MDCASIRGHTRRYNCHISRVTQLIVIRHPFEDMCWCMAKLPIDDSNKTAILIVFKSQLTRFLRLASTPARASGTTSAHSSCLRAWAPLVTLPADVRPRGDGTGQSDQRWGSRWRMRVGLLQPRVACHGHRRRRLEPSQRLGKEPTTIQPTSLSYIEMETDIQIGKDGRVCDR